MKEEWLEWIKGNIFSIVFGGVGLVLMGVGLIKMAGTGEPQEVEIISAEEEQAGTVVVDVAGAVQKPGVFEMDEGVRVADVLAAAGGLAVDADRDWVARFINQAEPVRDGMKLFIPLEGERESVSGKDPGGGVAGVGVVNVNTASKAELDELWGIGEARASAIIENRPYGSLEEMVSKAGLPDNVLEENQDKMTVF